MSELLLDSLDIKGYRCFEHLTIEKLGRVNLIVGKNNVGKTALLEALSIYVNKGDIRTITNSLETRDETQRGFDQISNKPVLFNLSLKTLFNTSENQNLNLHSPLTIKGVLSGENGILSVSLPELINKEGKYTEIANKFLKGSSIFSHDEGAVVEIKFTRQNTQEIDLEYYVPLEDKLYVERKFFVRTPNIFIRVDGLRNNELLMLWDETNKNNLEKYVTGAMQILEKNITDISFLGIPSGSNNLIPHVVVSSNPVKLPLRRFGNGMIRLLGLSLALTNCRNGILLIDEIENGLHYSTLLNVWKLVFTTAKYLNIQVFATTHSWDCIEAFTQVAVEDKESEGMLIRLEDKNGGIKATTFNEDELEAVTRRHIEVR